MANNRGFMSAEMTIRRYWARTELWERKGFDSPEEFLEDGICFACGLAHRGGVERAHILSRYKGGSARPENLHMLCHECHKASEFLDGPRYWRWFWSRTPLDCMVGGNLRAGVNVMAELIAAGVLPGAPPDLVSDGPPAPAKAPRPRKSGS